VQTTEPGLAIVIIAELTTHVEQVAILSDHFDAETLRHLRTYRIDIGRSRFAAAREACSGLPKSASDHRAMLVVHVQVALGVGNAAARPGLRQFCKRPIVERPPN
jgi:hypothetical protein